MLRQELIAEIAHDILRDAGDWGEVYEDTDGKKVFHFWNEGLLELYEDDGITEADITENAEAIMEAAHADFFWNYNCTESITYDGQEGFFKVIMEGDEGDEE